MEETYRIRINEIKVQNIYFVFDLASNFDSTFYLLVAFSVRLQHQRPRTNEFKKKNIEKINKLHFKKTNRMELVKFDVKWKMKKNELNYLNEKKVLENNIRNYFQKEKENSEEVSPDSRAVSIVRRGVVTTSWLILVELLSRSKSLSFGMERELLNVSLL